MSDITYILSTGQLSNWTGFAEEVRQRTSFPMKANFVPLIPYIEHYSLPPNLVPLQEQLEIFPRSLILLLQPRASKLG